MIDYQEIGNNIKICRIRCNLKQAELAEMVGVTSQHISHVERCQTKPSLTLLVDISTALRVDLYTLLGSNIPVHPDVSISVEFAITARRTVAVPSIRPFQQTTDFPLTGNACILSVSMLCVQNVSVTIPVLRHLVKKDFGFEMAAVLLISTQ